MIWLVMNSRITGCKVKAGRSGLRSICIRWCSDSSAASSSRCEVPSPTVASRASSGTSSRAIASACITARSSGVERAHCRAISVPTPLKNAPPVTRNVLMSPPNSSRSAPPPGAAPAGCRHRAAPAPPAPRPSRRCPSPPGCSGRRRRPGRPAGSGRTGAVRPSSRPSSAGFSRLVSSRQLACPRSPSAWSSSPYSA